MAALSFKLEPVHHKSDGYEKVIRSPHDGGVLVVRKIKPTFLTSSKYAYWQRSAWCNSITSNVLFIRADYFLEPGCVVSRTRPVSRTSYLYSIGLQYPRVKPLAMSGLLCCHVHVSTP